MFKIISLLVNEFIRFEHMSFQFIPNVGGIVGGIT